jgi:dTDP-4-amino-4,6-dideoxygalactose transaminase
MSTGGEGSMVTTNDETLWKTMWSYKDHGKSWDAIYNREHPPGFRWLHESFGTNWRMTEMQATIGRIQLTRMRSCTESRQAYAKQLDDAASSFDLLRLVAVSEYSEHAEYKHYMFTKLELLADGWLDSRPYCE